MKTVRAHTHIHAHMNLLNPIKYIHIYSKVCIVETVYSSAAGTREPGDGLQALLAVTVAVMDDATV